MDISGIHVDDPIHGSQPASGSKLGRDSFMRLLVQQLKNQDPLEPAKNEQMLAQLAQFSSLEEMQELNENIVGLAVLQQSNALMAQLTDSSALIGKSVQYLDPVSNEKVWGSVDSVKIAEGLAVLQIGGKDVPLASVTQVGQPPDPGSGGGGGDGGGS